LHRTSLISNSAKCPALAFFFDTKLHKALLVQISKDLSVDVEVLAKNPSFLQIFPPAPTDFLYPSLQTHPLPLLTALAGTFSQTPPN